MRINEKIAKFIHLTRDCRVPGLIMSTPGLGKTSTIEMYCKVHEINLTTLVASQYAPDDILGIQSVVDGKLVRLTPDWYDSMKLVAENGRPNLLFLDELTTCNEFIQAPLLNLIFNQSLGGHKLPDNTFIVAAGNYSDCLDGAFSISMPLINRFLILNLNSKDVDLNELLSDKFSRIQVAEDEEVLKFLGLDSNSHHGDLSMVKKIIASLDTSKVSISNSIASGLKGFASIRSCDYCMKYLESAEKLGILDSDALKVVNDTLGCDVNVLNRFSNAIKSYASEGKVLSSRMIARMTKEELENVVKDLISNPSGITEAIYKEVSKRSDDIDYDLLVSFKKVLIS